MTVLMMLTVLLTVSYSVNDCTDDVDCIVDCIVQCYWKWPGYVIIKIESRLKSCCLNVKINQLINTRLSSFDYTRYINDLRCARYCSIFGGALVMLLCGLAVVSFTRYTLY